MRTVVLVLALLWSSFSWSQGLTVTPGSHDFGRILQHTKVETTFTVQNQADHPIELTSVKANCGCTVPVPDRTELKPGESAEIHVTFDAGYFLGRQEKAVYITTSESKRYTVFIYANVVREYSFEPALLRLKGDSGLQKRTVHLVSNVPGKTYAIRSVKTDSVCLSVSGSGNEMTITLPADSSCRGEQTIEVQLTDMEKPVLYKVLVEQSDDVVVIPRVLMFMGIRSGTEVKRSCRFKISGDREGWRVTSAKTDLPFLRVDGMHELALTVVTVPDRMKKGYGKGHVTVVLSGPGGTSRQVDVPVAYNLY